MARTKKLDRDEAEKIVSSAQTLAGDRSFHLGLAIGAIVTVLVAVFIFQNADSTDLEYLWLDFTIPLWIGLLIAFGAGALAAPMLGWSWRHHRRTKRERKEAERRLADAEKQLDG